MHTEELISLWIMEEKHGLLFAYHLAKCQEEAEVISVTTSFTQCLNERQSIIMF